MKLKPCPWCKDVPVWRPDERMWFVDHEKNCFLRSRIRYIRDGDGWNNRSKANPPLTPSVPLTMCGHLHAKLPGED